MSFNNEPIQEKQKERQNPNNWIWGIFYYNPNDNKLFSSKKTRNTGWTINFAHPNSAFLILIILAVVLIIAAYFK